MDRRTTSRLDVELKCCVGSTRVVARPYKAVTKNVSRSGMLMRWDLGVPVPLVGRKLTVDLELPENSDFGPRVMQCRATVVRIEDASTESQTVALRIHSMKFIQDLTRKPKYTGKLDLASMPVHTTQTM